MEKDRREKQGQYILPLQKWGNGDVKYGNRKVKSGKGESERGKKKVERGNW